MRVVSIAFACVLAAAVSGCADPNTHPTHLQFGDSDTLVVGSGVRLVSERPRAIPGDGTLPTACTEPSPDVAIAFGRSLAASANYSAPSGPTVSGSVNAATTETATALAGRTAGVLALRDGLYAACQAYTNGVLGHDAYAVILSQYGNLLVALAGTGTAAAPNFTPQDAALAALLVSCISEYDPTRLGAVGRNGRRITNPLLSIGVCRTILANLASGRYLAAPKTKKVAAAKKTEAPSSTTVEKVSSTKTTVVTPPVKAN